MSSCLCTYNLTPPNLANKAPFAFAIASIDSIDFPSLCFVSFSFVSYVSLPPPSFFPIQSQLWHDFSSLSIVVINWEQFIMKWGWIIWMSVESALPLLRLLSLSLSRTLLSAAQFFWSSNELSTMARRSRDLMKDRYKRLTTCCTLHSLWIVSVIFKSVLHGKTTTIYHRSTDPPIHRSAEPPNLNRWSSSQWSRNPLQTIREPVIASPWLKFR